jgi:hypothetical protein
MIALRIKNLLCYCDTIEDLILMVAMIAVMIKVFGRINFTKTFVILSDSEGSSAPEQQTDYRF